MHNNKIKIFSLLFVCWVFFYPSISFAGVILDAEVSVSEKKVEPYNPLAQKVTENLLNNIDVYALSPHGKSLIKPRMISIQLLQQFNASKKTLSSKASSAKVFSGQIFSGQIFSGWSSFIHEASQMFGLDAALIAAVIKVESNFNLEAVSTQGAQGLMQIMPATQQDLAVVDPFDPKENIFAGSKYLRQQLDRFGSVELALAAYNAGPGNVITHQGIPPFNETQNFVAKVLQHWKKN